MVQPEDISKKDTLACSLDSITGTKAVEVEILYCDDEVSALKALVEIVRLEDPDIMLGYEIQMNSWGFLIQRAHHIKNSNLCVELSRILYGPNTSGVGLFNGKTICILTYFSEQQSRREGQ